MNLHAPSGPQLLEGEDGSYHEEEAEEGEGEERVGDLALDLLQVVGDGFQGHEDSEAGHVSAGTGHLTAT